MVSEVKKPKIEKQTSASKRRQAAKSLQKQPRPSNGAQRIEWPELRFYPVNSQWQHEKCAQLGLSYRKANHFGLGRPDQVLTSPNLKTIRPISADGNCLFRAFSYVITGCE